MASHTPVLLLKGRGEAVPVNGASANDENSRPAKTKTPAEGEKVIVRRLPPGMTESEFLAVISDEWKVGNGKVDWFDYVPGKIARDASKTSRASRAYYHVTKTEYLPELDDLVRNSTFKDAKNSFNDPVLVSPPYLEAAVYKKVPTSKKREDPRQGTIDQDPEFQAFLEQLANPTPPRDEGGAAEEWSAEEAPKARIETTPLVEDLRRKAKEAAEAKKAKHAARHESQSSKGGAGASASSASGSARDAKKKSRESKAEAKAEKTKEVVNVKILKKARSEAAEAAKAVAAHLGGGGTAAAGEGSSSSTAAAAQASEPSKSRRAGIAAAARLLQKDLGLSPGSAHRRARLDAAKAEAGTKPAATTGKDKDKERESTSAAAEASPSTATAASASSPTAEAAAASANSPKLHSARGSRGGRGVKDSKGKEKETSSGGLSSGLATTPTILKKRSDKEASALTSASDQPAEARTAAATSSSTSQKPDAAKGGQSSKVSSKKATASTAAAAAAAAPPTVKPGATRAFIKHANPSQGVTEQLLKQALEAFGAVTFVEVDKRKGFAYVDFAEHESLVRAVAASPVAVAQGTVQVLERKDKKPAPAGASAGSPAGGAGAGAGAGAGPASSGAATTAAGASAAAPSASSTAEKGSGQGGSSRRGRRGGGGGNKAAGASGGSQQGGGSGSSQTAGAS